VNIPFLVGLHYTHTQLLLDKTRGLHSRLHTPRTYSYVVETGANDTVIVLFCSNNAQDIVQIATLFAMELCFERCVFSFGDFLRI
jgi:hypothetical protein